MDGGLFRMSISIPWGQKLLTFQQRRCPRGIIVCLIYSNAGFHINPVLGANELGVGDLGLAGDYHSYGDSLAMDDSSSKQRGWAGPGVSQTDPVNA
jgi:hypothetical protein